ncbi:MAG TPA: carboxypeptidase M32 [Gaiellaceae bacterium]|nr:carboxypeptidase M32 [Gaiellaceae bacterium]
MNPTLDRLRTRLAQVVDLRRVNSLLFWDQQTMMPAAGAAARGEHRATLDRLAHELFVADETGRMLDELESYAETLDYDSDDASLIRVVRADYEKARRVPAELRAEMTRAASEGLRAWMGAKAESDFAAFLPALERNVELRRRYIDCFDGYDEPYDVLLDDYERGMKTAEVRAIFEEVKHALVPLIREAADRDADDDFLRGSFPVERQEAIGREVIEAFGFRPDSWRLDHTPHPFAGGAGIDDIRITTHYRERDLDSFFATMHEYGHGLYEHQVARELERTPLGSGVSLGVHESQSRMWENLVGRSLPFWRFFYGRLQAAFPEQLGDVELERFYRAVNRVHPSLIRIHADEVTYNLHIILRFELEQDIVNGRVELRDLAQVWGERMDEYLGLEVPDDARGVLQDMHWAGGQIGYFSTYSLGNVMSVQIWERVLEDVPDLVEGFERGEFAPLREWLGENLHRHGRKYRPQELLERAVGRTIDPAPYLRYLREKHGTGALTA